MNTLAHTTAFYQINVAFNLENDNTLDKLSLILEQLMQLVAIIIVAWQRPEQVILFISDILRTMEEMIQVVRVGWKVIEIVIKSLAFLF